MQSAANQVLIAGVRLVLDQSPFHVFRPFFVDDGKVGGAWKM